jgi:transposase
MGMRGLDLVSGSLFSYVDLDERIPVHHPLRKIRQIVNDALSSMDADFDRLYAGEGRPSIPPERLLRASLIQILYSIRSERQLMEQMGYNLLFRWFVGLGIDDPTWVPTVFSKNRDRLLTAEVARTFLAAILAHRKVAPLLSDDHFSVDGTLIKAWASVKSFQPKSQAASSGDGDDHDDPPLSPNAPHKQAGATMTAPKAPDTNATVDFKGHKRSNATPASVTDPQAQLYKRPSGASAILCFMGHALMENRHGFVVQAELTKADGHAERSAALDMVHRHSPGSCRRLTLGADKAYAPTSWTICARPASRPMLLKRRGHRQSMVAQHATRAMRHRNAAARRSRRHSAGQKLSGQWRKPCFAASSVSVPSSHSPWRPAISHGCQD